MTAMHIFQYYQFVHMPHFFKWDLVPPDLNDNIALMYSSSEHCIQPEDGQTRRGQNM
jgi:hypothetical protein